MEAPRQARRFRWEVRKGRRSLEREMGESTGQGVGSATLSLTCVRSQGARSQRRAASARTSVEERGARHRTERGAARLRRAWAPRAHC
eukprot:6172890-Pleurochrysis_carterae.AAC.2